MLTCVAAHIMSFGVNVTDISSENRVHNMTGFLFDKHNIARLILPFEYVSNELLTPEEFDMSDNIEYGQMSDSGQITTSRIRISVPEDRIYAFCGNTASYSSRIYINGVLLTEIGMPGMSREDMTADETYISFTAQPQNGIIEIVQQSSNFVYDEIMSHPAWNIGLKEPIARYMAENTDIRMMIVGIYLFLFFAHFTLFLIHRGYKANFWLALLCLVLVARTGVTGSKPFLPIFSWLSWEMAFRIEYISVPIIIALLLSAYQTLFPCMIQKIPQIATYVISLFFTALYLFADTFFMSKTVVYAQLFAAVAGVYLLARLFMKVRRPTAEQSVILAGLGIVFLSLIVDIIYYTITTSASAFISKPTMEYAVMAFSMFQIVAMFLGTMREVSAAHEREHILAAENAALDRANRLKTDLMHTVGHELRTPLAVMMGYAQLVSMEMKTQGATNQTIRDLNAIADEARRLSVIVDEMQEVSLSRTFKKGNEKVSVEAVIRQIARLYAPILERKHTSLNLNIQSGLPFVKGSADELTQVLFNLLSNAGAHTDNGEVCINAKFANNEIELIVSDTGTGIPSDLLPHIFENGVSGREGGTGLGLHICEAIIQNHGGHIHIQSAEGTGTTATFLLPAVKGGENNVWAKNCIDC